MLFNLARSSSVLSVMSSFVFMSTGNQAVSAQPHGLKDLGGNLLAQSGSADEDLKDELELLVQEENWAEAIVLINRMIEAEPSHRATLMDYRDRLLALLRNQSEQEKNALQTEIREQELREEPSRHVDWGPWLAKLKQKVEANWTAAEVGESHLVILAFDVGRDGELLDVRLSKSSGHAPTDNAAIAAIQNAAPFNPLPAEFTGNMVNINFQFEINVFGQLGTGGKS